jgi:hypothetical protein
MVEPLAFKAREDSARRIVFRGRCKKELVSNPLPFTNIITKD